MMINARTWSPFLAVPLFFSLGGCPQNSGCFDQYEANDCQVSGQEYTLSIDFMEM